MGYSALRVVSSVSDESVTGRLRSLAGDAVAIHEIDSLPAIERQSYKATDVVLIDLDVVDGLGAVQRLCRRVDAPIVIVVAGQGVNGYSLEYTLTLAELRGASVVFPKPVSVDELVEATLVVLSKRIGAPAELACSSNLEMAYAG